jgi:hypothetical protein
MGRARRNPIGLHLPGIQLVRVGAGEHTHVLDPVEGVHICRKGRNAGRQGPSDRPSVLYPSSAQYVTCYRCVKLATMNIDAGRVPWQGPRD